MISRWIWAHNPANIYLFKVNKRNTRKRWKKCEICPKLTITIPERRKWPHYFILFSSVSIAGIEKVNVSWEGTVHLYNFSIARIIWSWTHSVNICMFKVNNRNTTKRSEICLKVTTKTPERRHWRHSGVFIVTFEHISRLFIVLPLLTLNKWMIAGQGIF